MRLFSELIKKSREVFIEVRGRERVLTEGYCRIEGYSDGRIELISSQGSVVIYGQSLEIKHLSEERTAIEGRIERIEFV